MHYRSLIFRLFVAALSMFGACQCAAEDVVMPPWRGSAGTTFQDWRFLTNANPAALDMVSNPYGTPTAVIAPGPHSSGWLNYYAVMGPRIGYWSLGSAGTITATVPDAAAGFNARKDVWVQIAYFEDITERPAVIVPGGTLVQSGTQTVEPRPTGGAWKVDWSKWTLNSTAATDAVTVTSDVSWGSMVDEVIVDTRFVALAATVAEAKQLPDGTPCEVAGAVVTREFDTFFYIQDPSRAAGIRVNCADGVLPPDVETAPVVTGIIRTVNGERVIDTATVVPGGSGHVRPVGMANRSTMLGLSPLGLLVTLWGHADVASPDATEYVLSDGSPQPVRVQLYQLNAPQDGEYVSVTGVLGADEAGSVLRVSPTAL